jgi:hypothetical protein
MTMMMMMTMTLLDGDIEIQESSDLVVANFDSDGSRLGDYEYDFGSLRLQTIRLIRRASEMFPKKLM